MRRRAASSVRSVLSRCLTVEGRPPTSVFESAIHVAALSAFIWVVVFQLPKARREQGAFAVLCSVLTGLLALAVWLFGVATH